MVNEFITNEMPSALQMAAIVDENGYQFVLQSVIDEDGETSYVLNYYLQDEVLEEETGETDKKFFSIEDESDSEEDNILDKLVLLLLSDSSPEKKKRILNESCK